MLLMMADIVARTSTAEYVHTVLRLALCNACEMICNQSQHQPTNTVMPALTHVQCSHLVLLLVIKHQKVFTSVTCNEPILK